MRYDNTYVCETCDFTCRSRKAYNQHVKTSKHRIAIGDTVTKDDDVVKCHGCGGIYGSRTSLWRHKKECPAKAVTETTNGDNMIPSREQVESLIDTTILAEVLRETRTLREAFVEQTKTIENLRLENERQHRIIEETLPSLGSNITNVTNNNFSNNFNVNVFLNEKCKNALNLSDFVNSIIVQVEDLEKTKSIGYVRGVTDIIVRNLRQLDIYSRPIHCSDPVQEIMYVKNDDIWHQDEESKPMVRGAISAVAKKQLCRVKDWEAKNPSWIDSEKGSAEYIQMVRHVTSSTSNEEQKIVRNIAREVTIDKTSQ